MKERVRSDQIAHLWAHQTQPSATSPGAMSFQGAKFYSYGAVIGKVIEGTSGRGYLIGTGFWSMTTSKHQSTMREAIPNSAVKFYASNLDNPIAGWAGEIAAKLEESAKSRKPKNTRLLAEAASVLETMHRYAEFMGLKRVKYPKLPGTVEEVKTVIAAEAARQARADKALAKRRAAEYEAERPAREAEEAERRAEQLARLEEWREGKRSYVPNAYALPTELRIVDDEVETSRGATFPVTHAVRALALVDSVRESGEEWIRNGHTFHIGHYELDRITPDGTVYAGCHVVPFESIERIRPLLKKAA